MDKADIAELYRSGVSKDTIAKMLQTVYGNDDAMQIVEQAILDDYISTIVK